MTLTVAGGSDHAASGFVMEGDPVRVRMKHQMSGTRDGKQWPAPGEEITLSEDEAATLLGNGMAVAVEDRREPEKATASRADTAVDNGPAEAEKATARKPSTRAKKS